MAYSHGIFYSILGIPLPIISEMMGCPETQAIKTNKIGNFMHYINDKTKCNIVTFFFFTSFSKFGNALDKSHTVYL
jgi:hypothetical protein